MKLSSEYADRDYVETCVDGIGDGWEAGNGHGGGFDSHSLLGDGVDRNDLLEGLTGEGFAAPDLSNYKTMKP